MKKLLLFSFLVLVLASCTNRKSNCIKKAMDNGASYEAAKEGCEDAERDSQIR